jgi:hypothetical protein
MKPIFTIHAGEYLVAAHIEQEYKKVKIWLPSKDTGIDLLLTNIDNSKATSLQVKFSKDFNVTHAKEQFRQRIKGSGWWSLTRDKIEKSTADFWVFVLYGVKQKSCDFVILKPKELLDIFDKTKRTDKSIQCYITVTENETAFETRGLTDKDMEQICSDKFKDEIRDLSGYLNIWEPILEKLEMAQGE